MDSGSEITDQEFKTIMLASAKEVSEIKSSLINLVKRVTKIEEEAEKIKSENLELRTEVMDLKQENKILKSNINQIEQYSRKNNVIVNGIPEEKGENIREIIKAIADVLDVSVHNYDICAAHRLPGGIDNARPIIIRFNNSEIKPKLIAASKKNRITSENIGFNIKMPIFITEHLTRETTEIFQKAKELRNRGLIEFAWCRNGSVFIRHQEDSQRIRINDHDELKRLEEQLSGALLQEEQANIATNTEISIPTPSSSSANSNTKTKQLSIKQQLEKTQVNNEKRPPRAVRIKNQK